jgi:hypothetical protein
VVAREIRWSVEKDLLLRSDRTRGGIGLAECVVAIEEGRVLDDLPNQFVQDNASSFLKSTTMLLLFST